MAAAITVGSLSGGLLSPLFGPLADRLGPRALLPLGGALVGLLAVGVSASTEPWQFYATFIPARALTEFLLCGMIAFTAGQLVSCHAAAGYGISCDGDAAGLGGIVFSLSVFCHSLRLAQCVSRPRHSTLVVGGDSRINILTPPARGSRIVSRRHSSERSPA